MILSRRSFVRALGAGSAGALALSWVSGRGREASAGDAAFLPRAAHDRTGLLAVSSEPIRLDSNENPYGPGPAALQEITNAFGIASRYPDAPEDHLQEAVARWHGVATDNILMGCGSTEILRMAVHEFTSPSRGLVTAMPSFEATKVEAEKFGAPVAAVPLDAALKLDLTAMADKAGGAGLIYVCNPNNPTGTVQPASAIKDFVGSVLRKSPGTTILIDEAYHEYVEDQACATAIPLAMERPNVIVSRTFSKIFGMAGLRVGYAVAHGETLDAMRRHKLDSAVNVLGAVAAMTTFNRKDQVERQRLLNHEVREFTKSWFESARYTVVPSQTNFLMVDIRRDPKEFRASCRKLNVWVGRPFPPLATHARITIGTMDEMKEAVAIFGRVLGAGSEKA